MLKPKGGCWVYSKEWTSKWAVWVYSGIFPISPKCDNFPKFKGPLDLSLKVRWQPYSFQSCGWCTFMYFLCILCMQQFDKYILHVMSFYLSHSVKDQWIKQRSQWTNWLCKNLKDKVILWIVASYIVMLWKVPSFEFKIKFCIYWSITNCIIWVMLES